MGEHQDVEISLGTGRLLLLFFGIVVICAIFFGVGFTLGKNSATTMLTVAEAGTALVPASGTAKPKPGMPASATASPGGSSPNELTFYKAVERKEAAAQLSPAPAGPTNSSVPAAEAAPMKGTPAPEMTRSSGGYIVQVAAVSKQEDAEALVNALRKKSYPVFVLANAPTDKLFHVQVGPFADLKDAEGMRARLAGDGYNPILKK